MLKLTFTQTFHLKTIGVLVLVVCVTPHSLACKIYSFVQLWLMKKVEEDH